MRFGRRVLKFLIWSLIVTVTLTAAGCWLAYAFVTDSDTLTRLIQAELVPFLPNATVQIGRVEPHPFTGKVVVRHVYIRQTVDGRPFTTLEIPWLQVRFNPAQLLHRSWSGLSKPIEFSGVDVAHPILRLRRRKSGPWNIQDLLADPLPVTVIESPPPVVIANGTIELVTEEDEPAAKDGDAAPQKAKGRRQVATPLLRDVSLNFKADVGTRLAFDGSAKGDMFNRIAVEGTVDPAAGDADAKGGLFGLTLSDAVRRRLPAEFAPSYDAMALKSGEINVELKKLAYRPAAQNAPKLSYEVQALLHNGVCECPALPFPINRLSAQIGVKDGVLTVAHAEGFNGSTTVRAKGTMAVGDPETTPLDLRVDVFGLELDQRVKDRTPPEFLELWDVFKPRGRVDALVHLLRNHPGGPIGVGATVHCRDVASIYRHFPYPLENLNGTLTLENQQLDVELHGLVGDKPAFLKGTILNPGPDAVVNLDVEAESVPIDRAFLDALPPEVRPWVDQFHPGGAVKGKAHVFRKPLVGPGVKPEGQITIDAFLDLNGRCEITWKELPYTVRHLSGTLEIHPDLWIFRNMKGRNGQATITGAGRVEKLPGPDLPNGDPPLKIDLEIAAENLPFNDDLRTSLQAAWQKSWSIINPYGASDVTAKVHIQPNVPDDTRITIVPLPESGIRLVVPKSVEPGVEPGQTIELRMDDAQGRFEFVNGKVAMRDVDFMFHGAPVRFAEGEVEVKDSGAFDLAVRELRVRDMKFDSGLRRLMPRLMAQFTSRLDDGNPFTATGNLKIGWSGEADELAWCSWDQSRVFFLGNSIRAGVPLEHIQGQLDQLSGSSNGRNLEVRGIMDIKSVDFAGLQITELKGPIEVREGVARLKSVRGRLLGGELFGDGEITLADDPRYQASLRLTSGDLQAYARSLPGHQDFRGVVNARVEFNGWGSEIRNMQGRGEGHITEGDIGQLPTAFRLVKGLNQALSRGASPRGTGKTAFDSADLVFQIVNGTTNFEQIKLTGGAFSLVGRGTRDPLDNIDLRLEPIYGRGRFGVPVFSTLLREASGQLMVVRVRGTLTQPKVDLEPIPQIQRLGAPRNRD